MSAGEAVRLDRAIDSALDEGRLAGISLIVLRGGETAYERHAGHADREAGTAVGPRTIFRLASMSKPIVSATALALAEHGELDIDAPVHEALPEFRPRLADGREARLSARHLLTHTSGLTYGFLTDDNEPYRTAGVSDGLDAATVTLRENLCRAAAVPLAFEPGSAWRYSISTDVLGALLEALSGTGLAELARRHVTGPLGLADTGFEAADPERLARQYADPHRAGEPARPMADPDRVALLDCGPINLSPGRALDPGAYHSGGSGMLGTAREYARFLEAIRAGGEPILGSESVASMTTNRIGGLYVDRAGPGIGFGHGFAVVTDPAAAGLARTAGSFGWGGAYGGTAFVDPGREMTVVSISNTALEGMEGRFVADLETALYPELLDRAGGAA